MSVCVCINLFVIKELNALCSNPGRGCLCFSWFKCSLEKHKLFPTRCSCC